MERYLFYHTNYQGAIIIDYTDENGNKTHDSFIGYSLRKALRVFHWRNNLNYKHITVQKLY